MPKEYTFRISMSVLDHLGRNLYRSFATILGEAISNAWDADATTVWIYIDKDKDSFLVKDDGIGMSEDDFQTKFLKIGYTKRLGGRSTSENGRPFIGRKGIGKLALLSCAKRISVISRRRGGEIVGGVIDNSELDKAITDDIEPSNYKLQEPDLTILERHAGEFAHGTIIYFESIEEGIRKRLESIRRIIALYFRFSLLDDSFSIFLEDKQITLDDLAWLSNKTQFLWKYGALADPFVDETLTKVKETATVSGLPEGVNGFIASVEATHNLKLEGTDERVGVDLFVNGRLRERDILRHLPLPRIAVNYLYGQVHFNDMDDEVDRFATSREGIVAADPRFSQLLDDLKSVMKGVLRDWDKWRRKHRQTGDSENDSITKRRRASEELFNAVVSDFLPPEDSRERERVDEWANELYEDATFNFESYGECFVSENLARNLIREHGLPLDTHTQGVVSTQRRREENNKRIGNLSINIRHLDDDLFYLDMENLAKVAEPRRDGHQDRLITDEKQFTPIRNAVMHTSRLTDEAKRKLTAVYENIKAKIRQALSSAPQPPAP